MSKINKLVAAAIAGIILMGCSDTTEDVEPAPVEQEEQVEEAAEPEPAEEPAEEPEPVEEPAEEEELTTFAELGLVDAEQVERIRGDLLRNEYVDYTSDDPVDWYDFATANWEATFIEQNPDQIEALGIGICYIYTEADNIGEFNAVVDGLEWDVENSQTLLDEAVWYEVCPERSDEEFAWMAFSEDGSKYAIN